MMNKRICSMIDEIFADMKMTAENLALRDELMANAQARFDDSVKQGRTEEEAFADVAASLGDVQALLSELNGKTAKEEQAAKSDDEPQSAQEQPTNAQVDGEPTGCAEELGDMLNKALGTLGGLGQQILPQAKKFVKQVDSATGGVIVGVGKAVTKSVRDAQKAAGDVISHISKEDGEIVFDFGKEKNPLTPEELRTKAQSLRAEAELKQAVDDQDGAREMRAQAYALETRADAIEQAQSMQDAQNEAARQTANEAAQDAQPKQEAPVQPNVPLSETLTNADGEIDEDAFSRVVDELAQDVQQTQENQAPQDEPAQEKTETGCTWHYPAAGLRTIDIKLDSDDVSILQSDDSEIAVLWQTPGDPGDAPVVTMDGHTLSVRRRNPDVFKTFFSVFQKEGGRVQLLVPRGYAADYSIGTTSGDIHIAQIDVDNVSVNTTSGSVRLEPDSSIRANEIEVSTVSGKATISVCAGKVDVNTVSGNQFISCDANTVDANVVSGKVHAEGSCDNWEINSVSGDIELLCTVSPTGRIKIGTMSGSARVALPGDIRGFAADIQGMSASIANEFGPNRYGTCALPIHMETMSGKMRITRL